jgi:hypothetical protein
MALQLGAYLAADAQRRQCRVHACAATS